MRRFASTGVIAAAFFTAQLSQQTQRKRVGQWLLRAHLLPAHLLSRIVGDLAKELGVNKLKNASFFSNKKRCFLIKKSAMIKMLFSLKLCRVCRGPMQSHHVSTCYRQSRTVRVFGASACRRYSFTVKVINRALPSAPLRVSLVAVHPCAPTTAISAAWCPANLPRRVVSEFANILLFQLFVAQCCTPCTC